MTNLSTIFDICIIIYNVRIILTGQVFVKYEVSPDTEFPLLCAIESASNNFSGVSIDERNGTCALVLQSSNPINMTDTIYLKKNTTIDTYKDDLFINPLVSDTAWFFPGKFGVGAKLKVFAKLPLDSNWIEICFTIARYPMLGQLAEVCFYRQASMVRLTNHNGTDRVEATYYPTDIVDGEMYTVEFHAEETRTLIYVSDILSTEIDHCLQLETIEVFELVYSAYRPLPNVTKIVFIGI